MNLFDSHCHIDDTSYNNDLKQVIERARNEGVSALMVVGVDLKTSKKAITIAQTFDHVITSVGIHPHDAGQCSQKFWTA